ncbi:MAG: septal ring lytic transglycosylase RlpA family protein [Nitrospirota bacterium]
MTGNEFKNRVSVFSDLRLLVACYALLFSLFFISSCSTVRYESYPKTAYEKTHAVASWYGPDFQGRPTSSGETFNMYANTCAHREYPFGTRLKVTNISNSRSVECTVNDRGPFVEGRDIDLSYACAKEIGLIGPGTGRVLLEVAGRDDSYIKNVNVQTVEKTGPFAIQVGSFTEGINAIRLKAGLNLKYENVYIQEADVKGVKYYRVRIGNFDNFNSAVSIADQLGREGYQTIVMKAEVKI